MNNDQAWAAVASERAARPTRKALTFVGLLGYCTLGIAGIAALTGAYHQFRPSAAAQAQTQGAPTAAATTYTNANAKQWHFEFSDNVIKKFFRDSEELVPSCRGISGKCYGATVTLANTLVDGIEWIDRNPPPTCLRDSVAEMRRGLKNKYDGVVLMVKWFENLMKTSDDRRATDEMAMANSIFTIGALGYMRAMKTCG